MATDESTPLDPSDYANAADLNRALGVTGYADRRADPGPLPAPPVEQVNQLRDAMQLTAHERDQVIDYVSGYDPRCMIAALDHIGRRRMDHAATVLEA